ncbi:GPP34 family phosphoprotein [Streptomyces sp. NTH33]|uniref:GOLPH3/VPS74 family protein n=1 Tax=Streptomyces sp. NTH33 TaxID=1735453 RepID=UPI000DA971C5|nr:GPP34 family phosphoprotein [Streptomyces sp. NTH33]PZH02297.1 GPP34 family phosphoprotein [Streptomyces sp. NTH33]
MTTSRDLLILSLDVPSSRPVEQGDLSLALAGAELVDLLAAGAVTLDGDRIVPVPRRDAGDRLLDQAGAALRERPPYESVEDWLWRRGEGLAVAYIDALEADGHLTGRRHRWMPARGGRTTPVDSPERRAAAERWAAHDSVIAGLAAAVGIGTEPGEELAAPDDDALVTVLAAVNDAVTELEAVRQRRRIENVAFDNIWRAP